MPHGIVIVYDGNNRLIGHDGVFRVSKWRHENGSREERGVDRSIRETGRDFVTRWARTEMQLDRSGASAMQALPIHGRYYPSPDDSPKLIRARMHICKFCMVKAASAEFDTTLPGMWNVTLPCR
ncbi:MAG: hypothetical protein ACREIC_14365 [Limisphaerales bacterium]